MFKNSSTKQPVVTLPSRWRSDRHAKILVLTKDGLTISAKPQQDRLTTIADNPFRLAFHNVISYFEITIVELPAKSIVAVGLAEGNFPPAQKQPGWVSKSYGYHSDDGGFFSASSKQAAATGPLWQAGDVIGCGVNRNRDVYFTHNGVSLGVRFSAVEDQEFYPIVGFKGPSKIVANFGLLPFAFHLVQEPAQILPSLASLYKPDQRVHISAIPPEIMQYIFSYVGDEKSIVQLGAVSKDWTVHTQVNDVWQPLFLKRWQNQKANLKIKSWYKFYKSRVEHAKKYGPDSHPIENCNFQFKCPMHWEGMNANTGDKTRRHCDKCDRDVHWVTSQEELRDAAQRGWCVSFGAPQWAEDVDVDDTWEGEMDMSDYLD